MKNTKLIPVQFAGAKVLSRTELKRVHGGGGQCGSFPNCTTDACVASSGPCIGLPGTCGTTVVTQSCTCAVVC